MTRLLGVGDEFGEDAILGRIEGMKDVIEQVNKQFKDPVRYYIFPEQNNNYNYFLKSFLIE